MFLEQENSVSEKSSNSRTQTEQQRQVGESMLQELIVLPAMFGAGYAAVNTAAEPLNLRVLQTVPEERAALVKWWRNNSSQANREVFAAQEQALSRVLSNTEIAKSLHATATADYIRTVEELLPHTKALGARVNAFAAAGSEVLRAEAESLRIMASSPTNLALAETKKFLSGPNLALHDARTIGLVQRHQNALQSGIREIQASSTWRMLLNVHADDVAAYANNPRHRVHDLQWLRHQHAMLGHLADGSGRVGGKALLDSIGTAMEMGEGGKLFIRGTQLGDLVEVAGKQLVEKEMTAGELAANKAVLARELEQSSAVFAQSSKAFAPLGPGAGSKLLTGLGVAGFSLAAGYNFDRALAHALGRERPDDRADENAARLAVDGCLVPAFLLSDIPMKFRVPLAVTAFGAGRVGSFVNADNALSPQLAAILKPNQADTLLMGAAIMAPLGARYKAIGIVGALAAGRVANLF